MKHFSDSGDPRPHCRKVYSDGIFTYSTNGYQMLRKMEFLPIGHYDNDLKPLDNNSPVMAYPAQFDRYYDKNITVDGVTNNGKLTAVSTMGLVCLEVQTQYFPIGCQQLFVNPRMRCLIAELSETETLLVMGVWA